MVLASMCPAFVSVDMKFDCRLCQQSWIIDSHVEKDEMFKMLLLLSLAENLLFTNL